jgi:outer membrane protein TolC
MNVNVGNVRRIVTAACLLGWTGAPLAAQTVLPPAPAAQPAPVAVAAGPLTLEGCLQLAFEKQPALAAARASLAAAEDGQQGLNNLPRFARIMAPDLCQRKQQAALGVGIASAQLWQAEWDTRYAVTRNYFSVIYVRTQQDLLNRVIRDLEKARKTAQKLLKSGDPDVKVTTSDLDLLDINLALLRARQAEAIVGGEKALAALREAIGIGPECPLEIAPGALPPVITVLDRDGLIKLALANRGEITQVTSAKQVTDLEVEAQQRHHFGLKVSTFASGADIHAQPVPPGRSNGEYVPAAIGPEMPPTLVGRHNDRVARASDLSQRAGAVVDKTFNLVALEAVAGYLKWLEARDKANSYESALKATRSLADRAWKRFEGGKMSGSEYAQATTLENQVQAQYNEALYLQALALAGLERITAGGYRIYPQQHP